MSVINQVLLELERRRASGAERGALPDHVRALPEGNVDHRGWWIAAGVAALVVAGGWVVLSGFGFPRHPATVAVLPGTDAAIEKVVAASAVVLAAGPEEPADTPASAPRPAGRLSFELSNLPDAQPAAPTQPEARRLPIPTSRVVGEATGERRMNAAVEIATVPAVVKTQAPAAADKAVGKAEIEKQIRQPTARELADNEYRKAAGSLHQGRLAEAQEGFRAALNLYPAHHGARQALVALLVESKAVAEAERVLQEGIKLAPEQIGFVMTVARLQVNRSDNAAAIATLQGALGHAQASPDYVAFLAALLQRQARHEDAIEQFQAALRLKPASGVWWLGLGMSLQAVNRGSDAQEAYRRAKATNNLNPELAAFADQRLRQLQ